MDAKVRIEYIAENNGRITDITLQSGGNRNNVSDNYRKYMLGGDNNDAYIYLSGNGYSYKFLGDEQINIFDSEGYRGYNSRCFSSEAKSSTPVNNYLQYLFPIGNEPKFLVRGENILTVVIVFDDVGGECAPFIEIGCDWQAFGMKASTSELKENFQTFFVYQFEKPVSEFTVTFKSWSNPNTFAKIARINTSYIKTYDSHRIIDLAASKEDRSDPLSIEYGLSSQYGSVALLDQMEEFQTLNECEYLVDNLNVIIDVTDDGTQTIGYYKTQKWGINANDLSVKVDLTDHFEKLKEIKLNDVNLGQLKYMFEQYTEEEYIQKNKEAKESEKGSALTVGEIAEIEAAFPPVEPHLVIKDVNGNDLYCIENVEITAKEFLEKMIQIGGLGDLGIHYEKMAEVNLRRIISKHIYLEAGSVFDALKKLMQACKMRMYIDAIRHDDRIEPIIVVHSAV